MRLPWAHKGFALAQSETLDRLTNATDLDVAEVSLRRKLMDCAAWQLLGQQLYMARQLYMGKRQPSINESNIESVKIAARELTSNDYHSFALISDLTSFVQVGDLLVRDPSEGTIIAEVKQGSMNEKILDHLQTVGRSPSPEQADAFEAREGHRALQQMGRILRQHDRMAHVTRLATSGSSTNPDTEQRVAIRETPLETSDWDDALFSVLEDSRAQGWALEIVDNCLLLAAYRGHCRIAGPHLFRSWLENSGGKPGLPCENLIGCMAHPLGLPVFLRNISVESMFDILFGRVVVMLGLDVDAFMKVCSERGLPARWSTRKEASRAAQTGTPPWTLDGSAVILGDGAGSGWLSDGIFVRIFHHATSPHSAVDIFLSMSEFQGWKTNQPEDK